MPSLFLPSNHLSRRLLPTTLTATPAYSIYTNLQSIYSLPPYEFNPSQIGLLYLFPGFGFLTSVWFLIPRIDSVYNRLTARNNGVAEPEFRLPLANVGSVLIPSSLFAFAWLVHFRKHGGGGGNEIHWFWTILPTYFYGVGQVVVFNTGVFLLLLLFPPTDAPQVQNYYIDSFSKYAASAIAGGSVFRSLVGGIVPLFAPMLFDKLGFGWGISVFGFCAVVIAPSPVVFYYFGKRVRERFKLEGMG